MTIRLMREAAGEVMRKVTREVMHEVMRKVTREVVREVTSKVRHLGCFLCQCRTNCRTFGVNFGKMEMFCYNAERIAELWIEALHCTKFRSDHRKSVALTVNLR